jgi:hypothetical protein
MLKILGIDLAGKEENPTTVCIMSEDSYSFKRVYSNKAIIELSMEIKPDIIAIDAPIMKGEPRVRKVDRLLKKYKILPPTLPSMKELTKRGTRLVKELDFKTIEVFPTATSKILRLYSKDYRETAQKLGINVKNKHELDAYLCSLTGKMHLERKTLEVGDKDGKIVVPRNIK